jgi:hypothetical protein
LSTADQRSTIVPPATRSIVIPVSATRLPVAGMPISSPVWLPGNVQRQATRSPSATRSSTVASGSANAARSARTT